MNEWDSLNYSNATQCSHCGRQTPMKVVVKKKLSKTLYYQDMADGGEWTEWQILFCPLCEKINVVESYSNSYANDILDVDERGGYVYTEEVKTTVLFPIADFTIPQPNPNMPPEIVTDFNEAKRIFPFSSRSSAALLRLAIQKICLHLGEKGKDINTDIQELVNKGLPQHIQQALDIVRVIGNEAVHPGEINVRDNPEITKKLFELVNEIINDRISKPYKQAEIEKIYQSLPENKLNGIRQRNQK